MVNLQVKIPEELYNTLKALGYQDDDIEREFLDDVVLQLYARHVISIEQTHKHTKMLIVNKL